MVDRSALPTVLVRAEAWLRSYEATWYLVLAVVVALSITAVNVVIAGRSVPSAAGTGTLWGLMFAAVYYVFDAATGTTRWPDSE